MIVQHCYSEEDDFFYDVNVDGDFGKVRGDLITRIMSEHVLAQDMFDRIYIGYIINPQEFWAPYPLTSISMSDPQFDSSFPPNSWGGASQALAALRAPRWFEHYGKGEDLKKLMIQWIHAMTFNDDFKQQLNPITGEYIDGKGSYSPAMCVYIDFVDRLKLLDK